MDKNVWGMRIELWQTRKIRHFQATLNPLIQIDLVYTGSSSLRTYIVCSQFSNIFVEKSGIYHGIIYVGK